MSRELLLGSIQFSGDGDVMFDFAWADEQRIGAQSSHTLIVASGVNEDVDTAVEAVRIYAERALREGLTALETAEVPSEDVEPEDEVSPWDNPNERDVPRA